MIRTVLSAAAIAAAMSAAAMAADLIVEEPIAEEALASFDWSGFYVGVHGGFVSASSTVSQLSAGEVIDNGGFGLATNDYEQSGWLLGLNAEYLAQFDQFVLGVAGDVSWAGLSGDFEVFTSGYPGDDYQVSIDALASLRLKAGVAAGNALFYVTGGLAAGSTHTVYNAPAGGPVAFDYEGTAVGWTAGLGASFAVTDNVVLTGEYRYTSLGEISGEPLAGNDADESTTASVLHSVTGGVSFKF